jgi:hypothetical protein
VNLESVGSLLVAEYDVFQEAGKILAQREKEAEKI